MTYRITALNARNIVKHKPICGRCGGDILSDKCIPTQARLVDLEQFAQGSWHCAFCQCNHPNAMTQHVRMRVAMCDRGAYDHDLIVGRMESEKGVSAYVTRPQ